MAANSNSVQNLSEAEQKDIILFMLTKVSQTKLSEESKGKINQIIYDVSVYDTTAISDTFYFLNRSLAEIEEDARYDDLLTQLKKQGIYTIMYRKSRLKGDLNSGIRLVNLMHHSHSIEYVSDNIETFKGHFHQKSGYALCSNGLIYFHYEYPTPKITLNFHAVPQSPQMQQLRAIFPERHGQVKAFDASKDELSLIHSITKHKAQDNDLIDSAKKAGVGLGISALGILLFSAVSFFGGPLWLTALAAGLFTGAVAYIATILYGVVNGIFVTKSCLPYFLVGHRTNQHSLIKSNKPLVQAFFWGSAAVQGYATILATLFALGIGITAAFFPPITALLTVLVLAVPIFTLIIDGISRLIARHFAQKQGFRYDKVLKVENDYHKKTMRQLFPSASLHAHYLVTGFFRNQFGFVVMPIIALGALATVITLSIVSVGSLALMFSPMAAIAIPVLVSVLALVTLIGLGLYAYHNQNVQIDDRNRLDFDLENDLSYNESSFYFDDNPELVQEYRDYRSNQYNQVPNNASPARLSNFSIFPPVKEDSDSDDDYELTKSSSNNQLQCSGYQI